MTERTDNFSIRFEIERFFSNNTASFLHFEVYLSRCGNRQYLEPTDKDSRIGSMSFSYIPIQASSRSKSLDAEQKRAVEEGPSDDELALFDLLFKENISKADRERLTQGSKALLPSLRELLRPMHDWTQNTATQAEVKVFLLDNLWEALPKPPFSDEETEGIANRVYEYVWQRNASGYDLLAA